MELSVTLLGTAASVPTSARGTSAALIARGGERWLVDCGEGTQRQLLRSGLGLIELDLILLTHLHGDHHLGLPGLLKTYALRGRTRPLRIAGPTGLGRLFGVFAPLIGRLPYRLELDERDPAGTEPLWAGDGARIAGFPTRHSVPSMGIALIEDDRPGAFDVAAATALGVPAGPAFGTLQRGGEVTTPAGRVVRPQEVLGDPRPGRRVVLTGDTEPCGATIDVAAGASVLVHEATFLDVDRERARETRHTTAREAAVIAREAGVDLLVLTHLSSRCAPREMRAEAAAAFPRAVVGRDFDVIDVPFPERGEPRVSSRRRRPPEPGDGAPGDEHAPAEARGTVVAHDL